MDPKLGPGGAPTRETTLPTDAAERKKHPVASGVLDYFPDAIVAISRVSWEGNEQHNPGQPLHWAREKSTDEADALLRHFMRRGTRDSDGMRHSAKLAWRALALLQKEIEAERAAGESRDRESQLPYLQGRTSPPDSARPALVPPLLRPGDPGYRHVDGHPEPKSRTS